MEPLRPWNVLEVSASRVPAREWCHLIRDVFWLCQAPFGRFSIANGGCFTSHLPAGANAGDTAPLLTWFFIEAALLISVLKN
ncbi:hypothetical protein Enr17x_03950 [Gimesia fumaroli]|uniref:Uncharacterized protein n=2 Tax=Gimesia TaxID=1649453 RepID=A0A517VES3_9PLAN|nr:hypothetical protein Pan161_31610 [Gimesia algae]QDV48383.1 hypothetical protein Enr17x_03950 [Gimesia fumaroli]